jgi:hypothetical protein
MVLVVFETNRRKEMAYYAALALAGQAMMFLVMVARMQVVKVRG